eukprot:CAMPEP_0170744670 /NCGR_PEP_ID=MMETSP0437-20130122/7900_1 /TAXON_ID=0 /ORGANISM="Sexangularia sp." /LENGTH=1190 /DNA_ID=CAMNT_0011083371 /DNA_START=208 /DNA_END=3780 /DNA_ORIENTATION=-
MAIGAPEPSLFRRHIRGYCGALEQRISSWLRAEYPAFPKAGVIPMVACVGSENFSESLTVEEILLGTSKSLLFTVSLVLSQDAGASLASSSSSSSSASTPGGFSARMAQQVVVLLTDRLYTSSGLETVSYSVKNLLGTISLQMDVGLVAHAAFDLMSKSGDSVADTRSGDGSEEDDDGSEKAKVHPLGQSEVAGENGSVSESADSESAPRVESTSSGRRGRRGRPRNSRSSTSESGPVAGDDRDLPRASKSQALALSSFATSMFSRWTGSVSNRIMMELGFSSAASNSEALDDAWLASGTASQSSPLATAQSAESARPPAPKCSIAVLSSKRGSMEVVISVDWSSDDASHSGTSTSYRVEATMDAPPPVGRWSSVWTGNATKAAFLLHEDSIEHPPPTRTGASSELPDDVLVHLMTVLPDTIGVRIVDVAAASNAPSVPSVSSQTTLVDVESAIIVHLAKEEEGRDELLACVASGPRSRKSVGSMLKQLSAEQCTPENIAKWHMLHRQIVRLPELRKFQARSAALRMRWRDEVCSEVLSQFLMNALDDAQDRVDDSVGSKKAITAAMSMLFSLPAALDPPLLMKRVLDEVLMTAKILGRRGPMAAVAARLLSVCLRRPELWINVEYAVKLLEGAAARVAEQAAEHSKAQLAASLVGHEEFEPASFLRGRSEESRSGSVTDTSTLHKDALVGTRTCRFWRPETGSCVYGDRCTFYHPPPVTDRAPVACVYGTECNGMKRLNCPGWHGSHTSHGFAQLCVELLFQRLGAQMPLSELSVAFGAIAGVSLDQADGEGGSAERFLQRHSDLFEFLHRDRGGSNRVVRFRPPGALARLEVMASEDASSEGPIRAATRGGSSGDIDQYGKYLGHSGSQQRGGLAPRASPGSVAGYGSRNSLASMSGQSEYTPTSGGGSARYGSGGGGRGGGGGGGGQGSEGSMSASHRDECDGSRADVPPYAVCQAEALRRGKRLCDFFHGARHWCRHGSSCRFLHLHWPDVSEAARDAAAATAAVQATRRQHVVRLTNLPPSATINDVKEMLPHVDVLRDGVHFVLVPQAGGPSREAFAELMCDADVEHVLGSRPNGVSVLRSSAAEMQATGVPPLTATMSSVRTSSSRSGRIGSISHDPKDMDRHVSRMVHESLFGEMPDEVGDLSYYAPFGGVGDEKHSPTDHMTVPPVADGRPWATTGSAMWQ